MRSTARAGLPLAIALVALACAPPAPARAQNADRLDVSAYYGGAIERFHSLGADSVGLSFGHSPVTGLDVDFRVVDLPFGKGPVKPSLHVLGGAGLSTRILGPAVPGMAVGQFKLLDFATGVALELPLDAFLKGNSGVGIRIGWDGGSMLTRTGPDNFLTRSRLRFDFVRTSGGLAGSSIGFGKGRDETFGTDSTGSGRWDVRMSIQGRLVAVPQAAPAPAKPGTKPAPAAAPAGRLVWAFADIDVDTDGKEHPDRLYARAGLAMDLSAFLALAFTPRAH